ncbi:desiccation-related protein PCC13-62 [Artemisia annua]|uniref:Desiccation-related protein PCC13-62 n=1 Tax=Artemisia annua TaxID=35608 RepID=A0A2U1KT53_ARTAN|nr:desiccation-related protein PCC13-62 [Artemisia annua]
MGSIVCWLLAFKAARTFRYLTLINIQNSSKVLVVRASCAFRLSAVDDNRQPSWGARQLVPSGSWPCTIIGNPLGVQGTCTFRLLAVDDNRQPSWGGRQLVPSGSWPWMIIGNPLGVFFVWLIATTYVTFIIIFLGKRAIKSTVPGFARPLLNLSKEAFTSVMNSAFDRPLYPLFDPYANDINYLLATYAIPYVGLTGYVGTIPELKSRTAKQVIAGLLGVEAGQDAVIRTLLYERATERVIPYGITVAEFTDRISELRNRLGHAGLKDEGLIVPVSLGADGRTTGNILSANASSLSYGRTPQEVLRILYQTGNEHVAGGFYPRGANGTIARKYLKFE